MSLLGIMLGDHDCMAFAENEFEEEDKDWVEGSAAANPPAKGRAKAKAKGRSQARGGKGTKFCEACQEFKPEAEFSLNQVVDMQCKKCPAADINGPRNSEFRLGIHSEIRCTKP